MSTTLLFGPVDFMQAKDCALPGSLKLNLTCKGDGSPSCAEIAESWGPATLPRLPAALARFRQPPPQPSDELALAAFSAGGGIVKRVLLSPDDRAPVRVVTLADATYSSWGPPGAPVPPEGLVLYALDVLSGATGPKLFVATASSNPGGVGLPSGSQTLGAIRSAVEARSGQRFAEVKLDVLSPAPVAAWQLGRVILADYQGSVPHAAHATVFMPQVWQRIVLPWWAGDRNAGPAAPPEDPSAGGETGPSVLQVVGGAIAAVTGFYGGRAAARRLSSFFARSRRGQT